MSFRTLATIPLFTALMLMASLTIVAAADWKVAQTSGKVFIQQKGIQLVSLSKGGSLKSGSVVVTDRNGRVKLVRGDQTMIVSPNSVVTIPGDRGGRTKILEAAGLIEYDVDHRKVRHFAVETPYLAALVKGTRFRVKVYKGGANVAVLRGLVEVTNLRSGERINVLAGQTAHVDSAKGISITGKGAVQPIIPGPVREALVAPLRGSVSASIGAGGVSASVGGVSASVGVNGVSASVGTGVSASVGNDGVSASVGGVSAGVGSGGVSASVGSGVSASVGSGGVSASVGGLGLGLR